MENNKISIIVPIYKVEQYIRRCVDSLLGQTYRDFELILVDDGSPDGCGAICDAYAGADSRVRVIHKENGGLSDARNAGLEIARGDWVAFVDSDDWVAPEYLERLLAGMTEADADICECGILRTDGTAAVPEQLPGNPEAYSTEDALRELIRDGVFHQYVWNKLYRRDLIGDIRFPKGKINEDEFWTYRVFGNAGRIAKISDPLYFYFQRTGSIMGGEYSLRRLDALEAKAHRQHYIAERYAPLAEEAKRNLAGSCIYAGQMTLKNLRGGEQKEAKRAIRKHFAACGLTLRDCLQAPGGNRVWFSMAMLDFWLTCRIKNLLKKGF